MVVNANTLFHFTGRSDTLLKILRSKGFWPRYCIERGWDKPYAVPQCCFCDIPLSAITLHTKKYGHYGLGMSKEWGRKKGMSPVVYYVRGSNLSKSLDALIGTKDKKLVNACNHAMEHGDEWFYRQIAMTKAYERKSSKGTICYFDEREWRYVPNLKDARLLAKVYEDETDFEKEKEELNSGTFDFLCSFNYSDIRYVILPNQKARDSFVHRLFKAKRLAKEDVIDIISKIVLHDMLVEDM